MKKEFTFNNQADNLYPVLEDMMTFIRTSGRVTDQKISGRCSIILTEMLTNAIKHAGVAPTTVAVVVEPSFLQMVKSDYGQLFLPHHTQHPGMASGEAHDQKIVITADPMSELFVVREGNHTLRFGVQDYPITEFFEVDGLMEHYGLLMITKASDQFYYEYQPETGLNLFRSLVNL